jgi:ABC-type protease/lipase transport system fused ATPase/permease subunit
LARALYNDPRIILLDEPNSNLDTEGDAGLHKTLAYLKDIGRTVIIITHKNNILQQVDKILLLAKGEVVHLGNRDDVLVAMGHPIKEKKNVKDIKKTLSNPVTWKKSSSKSA